MLKIVWKRLEAVALEVKDTHVLQVGDLLGQKGQAVVRQRQVFDLPQLGRHDTQCHKAVLAEVKLTEFPHLVKVGWKGSQAVL